MATYPTLDSFDFPVALAVADRTHVLSTDGDVEAVLPWKSVTKPLTALAALAAIDTGALGLDDPAGPDGSTVRHLLAHASGLPFEAGGVTQQPGRRRVYSNLGFEVLGDVVAAAVGTDVGSWVRRAVIEPLELDSTTLDGSPAHAASGSTLDVLALGLELAHPHLISAELAHEASTVQLPGLAGVLPGFGKQDHNDWGLGYEIRDHKSPHWTGSQSSPATYGHFGQSGSFLWVDPDAGLVAAFLGERSFRAEVHGRLWPALTDEILTAHGGVSFSSKTPAPDAP
ncbi:beta-lactamase [Beutenbergia cavernae DSM 12333]|uniref:Beta-lactamase n=1 Tax=Beutenbergia cavernae (strain ATCC BAA-8 / DSM 12333 / CCUG 43141 / JCM 11478 / NBRC 16432 / NCIMB 13614 / HKI 0122) TaxID=471853 RepID=C5C677_BEUC1|nr:serine hydrolase domain-containing protein [Beutenbergia cavernae]ACQ80283.1 beta-lactamase [Beutenbergia cavernae DSM 12333]